MLKSHKRNLFVIVALSLMMLMCVIVNLHTQAQSADTLGISVSDRIVTVKGQLEDIHFANNSMTILLTDSSNNDIVHAGSFYCMQNGSFEYSFGLPENAKTGIYRLTLGMFGNEENIYADDVTLIIDTEEPSENVAFKWVNQSEIGTVSPKTCSFYIYEREPETGDRLLYSIDGGEKHSVYLGGKYTSVILNNITNGVHKIEVTVENSENTKWSYQESFAIMEEYTHQFMDDFNFRGVGTHYAHDGVTTDNDINFVDFAGIKNIRDGIKWANVEKQLNIFNFSRDAKWVKQIYDHDARLATVLGFNNWRVRDMFHYITGEKVEDSNYIPRNPEELGDFADYVNRTMTNYPQFDRYELWNEPNADQTLAAADYTELAMNTNVAIKRKDRFTAFNVMSLMNIREKEWAKENFASGIYPYMTGVAFHPYVSGTADDGVQEKKYEDIYELIVDNGGWKDMSITEVGWATHTGGISETDAAIALVKQNNIVEKYDVTENFWYDLINDGTDASYNEDNFGLLYNDRKVKPAYIAFKEVNQKLAGAVFIGENNPDSNARMFVYDKDGNTLITAWAIKENYTINFDSGVTVEDIYGNVIAQDVKSVKLGTEPVYISGAGKDWIAKTGAGNVKQKAKDWQDKYSFSLPDAVTASAETLFSADVENASSAELKTIQSGYRQLGLDVIKAAADGEISEKEASKALYELYRILNIVNRMYIANYIGLDITTLYSDIDAAITLSNERYYNDFNMMQYSEEILRNARRFNLKAKTVLDSTENNPIKAGMISGLDLMSDILIDWFKAFSDFEYKFNYGLLLNVNIDTIAYIDTAKQGTEKTMSLYINNKGNSDFIGKLNVYNQKGEKVYTSLESFSVAIGNNVLKTLSFDVNDDTGQNMYTLELEDNTGTAVLRRSHEIDVYTDEDAGYPNHEGKGNYSEASIPKNEDLTYRATDNSDETRVFSVEGRRFVLLDKDEAGHYFVAADEVYGIKGFNLNKQTDENTQHLLESGDWTFDPSKSDNIATWLNGDFLKNGNNNMKIPEAMQNKLVEKDWCVEFAEASGIEAYSVKAKVALMSATEWMHYSDRLGYAPYNAPYNYPDENGKNTYRDENGSRVNDGWWLRTPYNRNGIFEAFVSVWRAPGIPGALAEWSARSIAQQRYVRPVFWLDSDFFEETAVELDTVGEAVKLEIAAADYEKLKKLYTDAELKELGIISVQYSDDHSSCTITLPDTIEATVYFATYNSDGGLIKAHNVTDEIRKGNNSFSADNSAAETQIFIWNDMIPIMDAVVLVKK